MDRFPANISDDPRLLTSCRRSRARVAAHRPRQQGQRRSYRRAEAARRLGTRPQARLVPHLRRKDYTLHGIAFGFAFAPMILLVCTCARVARQQRRPSTTSSIEAPPGPLCSGRPCARAGARARAGALGARFPGVEPRCEAARAGDKRRCRFRSTEAPVRVSGCGPNRLRWFWASHARCRLMGLVLGHLC